MLNSLALVALIGSGGGQVRGMDLLKNFARTLNEAQSLTAEYEFGPVRGVQQTYKVVMQKPDKARVETENKVIVADGKQITTYDKWQNSFFRQPQTPASLRKALAGQGTDFLNSFFDPDHYSKVMDPVWAGTEERMGMKLDGVRFRFRGENEAVLWLDASDRTLRQAEMTLDQYGVDTAFVLNVKSIALNGAVEPSAFQVQVAAGAREMSAAEVLGDGWFTNLHEAIAEGRRSKRMIFVDFYADW